MIRFFTLAAALVLTCSLAPSASAQANKTTCYALQVSQTAAGTASGNTGFITYEGSAKDPASGTKIGSATVTINYQPLTGAVSGGTYALTSTGEFGPPMTLQGEIPAVGRIPLTGDGAVTSYSRTFALPPMVGGIFGYPLIAGLPANAAASITATIDGRVSPPKVEAQGSICKSAASASIAGTQLFVAQHYSDFLNRAPDPLGFVSGSIR